MKENLFFVSGITGHVGAVVARKLLEDGHSVRTLLRDPKKAADWSEKGVNIRQGDFRVAADVTGALDGVQGAFLMLPPLLSQAPGFPETKAIIASFCEALSQTPPPRLVVLSSVGSQQTSGLGLITATHLLERALDNMHFPTAFIRAGSFLENYTYALKPAASAGTFDTFLTPTNRPVPMVAAADIGMEIARLLVDTLWSGKRIVELGSRISPDDLAQAMSEVLGRPVKANAIPRDKWDASLQAQGMSPGAAKLFGEMEDAFNSGWIDFGVPGAEPVAATVTAAEVFAQTQKA